MKTNFKTFSENGFQMRTKNGEDSIKRIDGKEFTLWLKQKNEPIQVCFHPTEVLNKKNNNVRKFNDETGHFLIYINKVRGIYAHDEETLIAEI